MTLRPVLKYIALPIKQPMKKYSFFIEKNEFNSFTVLTKIYIFAKNLK